MKSLKLMVPAMALSVVLSAQSQPLTGGGSAQKSGNLSSTDRAFLMTAAQDGKMEVEISQMAAERASSPEVKKYAQRMVTDHTRANEELTSLSRSKGLDLSKDSTAAEKHENQTEPMSKFSGQNFDREFMRHQVNHHRNDVANFEKHSKAANDPDVKAWAAKMLPILREHLKLAESVQRTVTVGTGAGAKK